MDKQLKEHSNNTFLINKWKWKINTTFLLNESFTEKFTFLSKFPKYWKIYVQAYIEQLTTEEILWLNIYSKENYKTPPAKPTNKNKLKKTALVQKSACYSLNNICKNYSTNSRWFPSLLKPFVSVLDWSDQRQVITSVYSWSFLSKDSALSRALIQDIIMSTNPYVAMSCGYKTVILLWIPNKTLYLNNCGGASTLSKPLSLHQIYVPSVKEFLSPPQPNILNLWCHHLEGTQFPLQIFTDLCGTIFSRIDFSGFRS